MIALRNYVTHLSLLSFFYLSQGYFTSTSADVVILSPTNQTVDIFENAELAFGAIPPNGISGKVLLSVPEDACSDLTVGPPNKTETWILLVRRYPCILETKVRAAAKAGFQAIMIYNVDPIMKQQIATTTNGSKAGQKVKQSPQPTTAITSTTSNGGFDHYIPTILISYIDGETIKQEYLYDKGYSVLIIPRIPFPINAYLLPFAIVIIVCLFLMVSFLIFQIINCIRDRRKLSRHRLTHRQLKQLLTTYYTKGSQYDTCAICLDEYVEMERLRVLPCGHGYHARCIDPWLTKSRRICPVCKGKVRVSGMEDISDTESESGVSTSRQQPRNNANESTPLLRNQRHNSSRIEPQSAPENSFGRRQDILRLPRFISDVRSRPRQQPPVDRQVPSREQCPGHTGNLTTPPGDQRRNGCVHQQQSSNRSPTVSEPRSRILVVVSRLRRMTGSQPQQQLSEGSQSSERQVLGVNGSINGAYSDENSSASVPPYSVDT